jgi:E3 ubiquitin-protein ligase HERC2
MAGVRVRGVAAARGHSLALIWDGRVYSWGLNDYGQLGVGDELERLSPTLVEGLEGVRSVAASRYRSLAVAQSGGFFTWGFAFRRRTLNAIWPMNVNGFGGVRACAVGAGYAQAFAIGEDGEVFSWGIGISVCLGHGDTRSQPWPNRVEALRGVRVSGVSVGDCHALALTEDGPVYAWGENEKRAVLGNPAVERELLPKPVEALKGVRVSSVAAAGKRSYALADTGELWAWGDDDEGIAALGHGRRMGEPTACLVPKPIEALRGVKVDAVAACDLSTLALADDGSRYAWGSGFVLGLGPLVSDTGTSVREPRRIPALRAGCWEGAAGKGQLGRGSLWVRGDRLRPAAGTTVIR